MTASKAAQFEAEALPEIDFLYRYGCHLAGDRVAAEDLVQETMLKAWRSWHRYRPGSNIRGWLAAILLNTYINDYRRRQRRAEAVRVEDVEHFWPLAREGGSDPEKEATEGSIDEKVVQAIGRLPLAFRQTLVLSDVEELPYGEIARITRVPVGTVKSRLFRARQILQRELRPYAVEMQYIAPVATAGA